MCLASVVASEVTLPEGEVWWEDDGWHVAVDHWDTDSSGLDLYTSLCRALLTDGALDAAYEPPWSDDEDLLAGWSSDQRLFMQVCEAGPTTELQGALQQAACSTV